MKQIAQFYTLFLIIYFPTCLAFQRLLGIDWFDEFLCIILMGFGVLGWRRRTKNGELQREMLLYWCIILFYTIYSIFIQITTFRGIYLDFLQQIRPYMVFYITMFLNPHFSKKQKKLISVSMIITLVAYVYTTDSIQRYMKGQEEGGLQLVALNAGMTYYLFAKNSRKNNGIAIAIMLFGLISGKSKYMGQCVCFIGLISFLKHKLNYRNPMVYLAGGVLMAAVIFVAWHKFDSYYVKGMQVEVAKQEQARPATYQVAFGKIIWEYAPFGSGLGSFGTAAAAKEYSPLYYKYNLNRIWGLNPKDPMFVADCFYPTLAEFGLVGIFLFLVFWKRRLQDIQKINDIKHYRMALMSVMALAINSTADTAYLSGVGMGLFITLAICLNSNSPTNKRIAVIVQTEEIQKKE